MIFSYPMIMLLEACNVERIFQVGTQTVTALARISLTVKPGEFLVITGPSGSGKSTFLNILSGLDCPSSGEVLFKGDPMGKLSMQQRATIRNHCFGFIFQTPHLLMDKTILENTFLPFHYGRPTIPEVTVTKCLELLQYVGVEHLSGRYPNTLSGGEMQRVVFARALCREPDVIFADEPTGSLDANNSKKILTLLQDQAEKGRTVIMVTHDPESLRYGNSLLSLQKIVTPSNVEKC